jgi:SAM-dependent methyltransferase
MAAHMNLEKAALYERYRLPYALALAPDLLARTGPAAVVADVGAGTGQLARLFAPDCTKVYAVEPDAAMRAVAASALAAWPNIALVAASAEQTTLPDESVDLIVIGNAWQRFGPGAGVELRRILRRSGWAAVINYTFNNQAFAQMLFGKLAELEQVASQIEQAWHRLPLSTLFGDAPLETRRYPQAQAEDWTAFFGAACAAIEAPTRGEAAFAAFEALNREVFDAFAVDGVLRVEYETRVTLGQPHGHTAAP